MKKEIVQNWMRLAWREGNEKEIANIPELARQILEMEEKRGFTIYGKALPKTEDLKPGKSLKKPIED